jgi:hypothetical protein
MADIDMTDAPGSGAVAARKKVAAADGDAKADGKKRFEVKKVRRTPVQRLLPAPQDLTRSLIPVERGRTLGVGHRRGQLRHLQKSHHGSL